MIVTADKKIRNLIIVGDRVLVRPRTPADKTKSGLFLPPSVQDNHKVLSGYVIKTGPGYPMPIPFEAEEPWKGNQEKVRYLPLQAKEGDLAIFLQDSAVEVMYEEEKYFIVPQSAILMLERDEEMFE